MAKGFTHESTYLADRNTENIRVGGMPFNVIITKTYEKETTDDAD